MEELEELPLEELPDEIEEFGTLTEGRSIERDGGELKDRLGGLWGAGALMRGGLETLGAVCRGSGTDRVILREGGETLTRGCDGGE